MTQQLLVWHGTGQELRDLKTAVNRYCDGSENEPSTTRCPSHHLLVESQQRLDDLLFARRIADQLRREEGLRS